MDIIYKSGFYMYDYIDQSFNDLTVIEKHPERTLSKKVQWVCLCVCGKTTLVTTQSLTNGNTKSCGCRRVESSRQNGKGRKTHGMTQTPEYKAWQSMKDRCYNEDCPNYPLYGGRGILVWMDWLKSFEQFYLDMGPRPGPRYSLDRIDVDGHYRPDNCRWATAKEQANNKRNNVSFVVNGQKRTIAELAREYNIPISTLTARLTRDHLSIEEALAKTSIKREYTHEGVTRRLNEWAVELGVSYSKLYNQVVTNRLPFDNVVQIIKENGYGRSHPQTDCTL